MGIKRVLEIGREKGASDIHILPGEQVAYRIKRKMSKQDETMSSEDIGVMLNSMFDRATCDEIFAHKEYDTAYMDDIGRRYRLNIHNVTGGKGISIRILDDEIRSIDDLGLPGILHDIIHGNKGMILVTGSTGSGKTTTLAAMVEELNKTEAMNILTIEDPIEYRFKSKKSLVRQRELNRDTDSFTDALKSALRQDPDVVLVGEMRDTESIRMAITVAETGHLVLGTLHTMSAIDTVNRIIDAFPPGERDQIRVQLASVIRCIINQKMITDINGDIIVACEILINTPAVSSYIMSGKINQITSVMESNKKLGMITMSTCLHELVQAGKISAETYQRMIKW